MHGPKRPPIGTVMKVLSDEDKIHVAEVRAAIKKGDTAGAIELQLARASRQVTAATQDWVAKSTADLSVVPMEGGLLERGEVAARSGKAVKTIVDEVLDLDRDAPFRPLRADDVSSPRQISKRILEEGDAEIARRVAAGLSKMDARKMKRKLDRHVASVRTYVDIREVGNGGIFGGGAEHLGVKMAKALGIEKGQKVYVDPIVASSLGFKFMARWAIENARGFSRAVQALKGNMTSRNIGTAVSNFFNDSILQMLRTGRVTVPGEVLGVMSEWMRYMDRGEPSGKLVKSLPEALKADPKGMVNISGVKMPRNELYALFDKFRKHTHLFDTDLRAEMHMMGSGGLFPPGSEAAKMAKSISKATGHEAVAGFAERSYAIGSNTHKAMEAVRGYGELKHVASLLDDGHPMTVFVDDRKPVHIQRGEDGVHVLTDSRGKKLKNQDLDTVLAQAAAHESLRIFFDYERANRFLDGIRIASTTPIGLLLNPFATWAIFALDLPGKKGLVSKSMEIPMPKVVSSSPKVNRYLMKQGVAAGLRRTMLLQSLRQTAQEDREFFNMVTAWMPKDRLGMLYEVMQDPAYMAVKDLRSWNWMQPTITAGRVAAWMGGAISGLLPVSDHDEAKRLVGPEGLYPNGKPPTDLSPDESAMWSAMNDYHKKRLVGAKATWNDVLDLMQTAGGPIFDVAEKALRGAEEGETLDPRAVLDRGSRLFMAGTFHAAAKAIAQATGDPDGTLEERILYGAGGRERIDAMPNEVREAWAHQVVREMLRMGHQTRKVFGERGSAERFIRDFERAFAHKVLRPQKARIVKLQGEHDRLSRAYLAEKDPAKKEELGRLSAAAGKRWKVIQALVDDAERVKKIWTDQYIEQARTLEDAAQRRSDDLKRNTETWKGTKTPKALMPGKAIEKKRMRARAYQELKSRREAIKGSTGDDQVEGASR